MSKLVANYKESVYSTIIYILGFFLFWEWLRPLGIVSDTGFVDVFVLFGLFCFILNLIKIPPILSFIFAGVAMGYILHYMFFDVPFFSFTWIKEIFLEVKLNLKILSEGKWVGFTDLFRSILFSLLLWIISYLIYYWVIFAKKILPFFVLTVGYLTVLDTFTEFQANAAIIRTVLIGFMLLGILHFQRIKGNYPYTNFFKVSLMWVLTLAIMVGVSSSVAFFAPKKGPQWPDPVPYIKSFASGEGFSKHAYSKVGYGENDSQLGGPFINDNTPVFTAEVSQAHYWKVETKDFYTGKGWEVSKEIPAIESDGKVRLPVFYSNVLQEQLVARINYQGDSNHPHIVYPMELKEIETEEQVSFSINAFTEKISTNVGGNPKVVDSYEVLYDFPTFSIEMLQQYKEDDPQELLTIYTQLPENLPNRVTELASSIVEDYPNRYDKVKAVERYLSLGDYQYETKDVPVPDKDQDYVDQFLFESKRGYCDNFSSAMVVMLRSVGIPARWTKGYTHGTYQEAISADRILYEVTNSNAHSWVEVFFPETGWVPFEPTPSFQNAFDFSYDTIDEKNTPELEDEKEEEKEEEEPLNEDEASANTGAFPFSLKLPTWLNVVVVILLVITGLIVFYYRERLWKSYVLKKYRNVMNEKAFADAYEILLKLLTKKHFAMKDGQTLREYAITIDEALKTNEMVLLTKEYEQILYSHKKSGENWKYLMTLWESLVKKILS